jgi:hypothetical protein
MEKNLAFEVLPRCFGLAGPSTGRTYTTQSRNYLSFILKAAASSQLTYWV